jgi:large subunit ribosomal protein L3
MLNTIFATKQDMSQVWTKAGKRLPVTKCFVDDNIVLGKQQCLAINRNTADLKQQPCLIFEIGYGKKKLKNTPKPLKQKIKQSGFSFGVRQVRGVKIFDFDQQQVAAQNTEQEAAQNQETQSESSQAAEQDGANQPQVGSVLKLDQVLQVGDVVKVTGVSKGKGFTGVVKRYKFAGGPRTHGQRDRERSPGSIGAMTDPGRVWKGKKMPGRHGGRQATVKNLTVVHLDLDKNQVWLSGPIPGHFNSLVRIVKTGDKEELKLDKQASGIKDQETT